MAETYGSVSIEFTAARQSAVDTILIAGSAVEALRLLVDGGSVLVSGANPMDVLQIVQMMAIVEIFDLIGPLVPHMGDPL